MNNQFREAIEVKKQYYIEKLLDAGIYKVSNRQLYRLTLSELERIFQIIARQSHG